MQRYMINAVVTLAAVIQPAAPVWGAGPVKKAHVEVELVSEALWIRSGQGFLIGLRMEMDEGWHTYWSNPGDAGLATDLQWTLPDGFQAGPIEWPRPLRFKFGDLIGFGYEGEVVLPVQIQPPALVGTDEVTFTARARWLACREACVQGNVTLDLQLPVKNHPPQPDARWKTLFAEARRHIPRPPQAHQITATRSSEGITLQITGFPSGPDDRPMLTFFPAETDTIEYAAPQVIRAAGRRLALSLKPSRFLEASLDRLQGVLVADTADQSVSLTLDVPITAAQENDLTLSLAIIYAVLGGLLLNLMPCVFPILSIKVLTFVQQAGERRARIRAHGLLFAMGVIASFWVLTVVLISLRAAGQELGWGFQLQSPSFVAVLALVMFAVGLNLAGVFELGLGLSARAGQAASGLQAGTYTGSFLTGVLATAVATPCTAPFMGAAIGFGITLSPGQTAAVFTGLGAGMALPYVLLSLFPTWLRWLPQPGPWMQTFKQLMAFPMFGAAVWLAWVFGKQVNGDTVSGATGVLVLLSCMWLLGVAMWIIGRWGQPTRAVPARWSGRIGGTALACAALAATLWSAKSLAGPAMLEWEPFTDDRVTELRSAGRVVFVDFTADWCLTCKFNERTVLSSDRVRQSFTAHNVALLKADWTRRDDHVTQALARFGRLGVPLYVVYGPNLSIAPNVLPDGLLTADSVINAVERAASLRQTARGS